jgi:carbonic anhydrase
MWFVLVEPIEMSKDQIAALETIMGENNRPIQDLNGRTLSEDNGPD